MITILRITLELMVHHFHEHVHGKVLAWLAFQIYCPIVGCVECDAWTVESCSSCIMWRIMIVATVTHFNIIF